MKNSTYRNAFKMKLKPGFEAEYKKRHDEIWPELQTLLSDVGIQDYSRKERDIFGEYNFIERSYADRANFTMWVENTQLDSVKNILASVRATPTLYIGSDDYTSTAVFGFYKDFDLNRDFV
jgi:DUF438 domain-containing protein